MYGTCSSQCINVYIYVSVLHVSDSLSGIFISEKIRETEDNDDVGPNGYKDNNMIS